MRQINEEDFDFLKNLQKEMLSQPHDCQAAPRFWVLAQYEWQPCWEEQMDQYIYVDNEDYSDGIEYESFEELLKALKKENKYCNLEAEEYDDLPDELKKDRIGEVPCKKVRVVLPNLFFITKKDAQDHMKSNYYHYNDTVHTYAMTAWRSPAVEKLYEILENIDFNKIKRRKK